MNTMSTDRKLQPTWTGPYRIRERLLNSYKLEELDGTPMAGEYNARRLRIFFPREGTELAKEQEELERRFAREEGEEETSVEDIENTEQNTPEDNSDDEEMEDVGVGGAESTIASRVAGRRGRRHKEGGGCSS